MHIHGRLVLALFLAAAPLSLACGSSSPNNSAGAADTGLSAIQDASMHERDAGAVDSGDVTVADAGGEPGDSGAAVDSGMGPNGCLPPAGDTCPPTTTNCVGIGGTCTRGGGQCTVQGTHCDLDLDSSGGGFCMKLLCHPNHGDCGFGATCCKTPGTRNVAVCLPNQCLPDDCMPE